jgi:hypothetical protein
MGMVDAPSRVSGSFVSSDYTAHPQNSASNGFSHHQKIRWYLIEGVSIIPICYERMHAFLFYYYLTWKWSNRTEIGCRLLLVKQPLSNSFRRKNSTNKPHLCLFHNQSGTWSQTESKCNVWAGSFNQSHSGLKVVLDVRLFHHHRVWRSWKSWTSTTILWVQHSTDHCLNRCCHSGGSVWPGLTTWNISQKTYLRPHGVWKSWTWAGTTN